jgi:hypothetical protein
MPTLLDSLTQTVLSAGLQPLFYAGYNFEYVWVLVQTKQPIAYCPILLVSCLTYSLTPKTDTVCFSETLGFLQTMRHYNPEDCSLHYCHCFVFHICNWQIFWWDRNFPCFAFRIIIQTCLFTGERILCCHPLMDVSLTWSFFLALLFCTFNHF